jgi:hypothetical protein
MKGFLCLVLTVSLTSCKPTEPQKMAQQEPLSANTILVINPYRYQGSRVFDDPRVGLVREPFVAGIPEMMDKLVQDIPNADKGFRLLFSATPFPGYMTKLVWRRKAGGIGISLNTMIPRAGFVRRFLNTLRQHPKRSMSGQRGNERVEGYFPTKYVKSRRIFKTLMLSTYYVRSAAPKFLLVLCAEIGSSKYP